MYIEEYNVKNYQILMDYEEFFVPNKKIQYDFFFEIKITLSKNAISSIEGNFLFCPVVSRIFLSLIFDDIVEILFVIVKRFFFVIPGDFNDETDRLFVFIVDVIICFGDNGWDISSLFVVDDTTVNDEDVGKDDDKVLLIIKRGGGLDTIELVVECIGGVEVPDDDDDDDDDNKISEIEFVRSFKKRRKKKSFFCFLLEFTVGCWLASGKNWLNSARRSSWLVNNCATLE